MDDESWTRRAEQVFDSQPVVARYADNTCLTPAEEHILGPVLRSGLRILDLGVGTGRTTGHLAPRSQRYVGLDLSAHMIEVASARHPGADLQVGDAADLSLLDDDSFDLVVFSYNGIDYLDAEGRDRCLRHVRRVLTPGGHLVLSSHNARALVRLPAAPMTLHRCAIAVRQTLARVTSGRTVLTAARGEGYVIDPVYGGLRTWTSTPRVMTDQLEALGFVHQSTVPSTHPARGRALATPWWYYCFAVAERPDR